MISILLGLILFSTLVELKNPEVKDIKQTEKQMMSKIHFVRRNLNPVVFTNKRVMKNEKIVCVSSSEKELCQFKKSLTEEMHKLKDKLEESHSTQYSLTEEIQKLKDKLEKSHLTQYSLTEEMQKLKDKLEESHLTQSSMKNEITNLAQKLQDKTMKKLAFSGEIQELRLECYSNQSGLSSQLVSLQKEVNAMKHRFGTFSGEIQELRLECYSNQSDFSRLALPLNLSKFIGAPVPGKESEGPISTFSLDGTWVWRSSEAETQEEWDSFWSGIMKGEALSIVRSTPFIFPNGIMGQFVFGEGNVNEMRIAFYIYDTKHNNALMFQFPHEFKVRIQIKDGGFSDMKDCKFKLTKLRWNYSENLFPINKNWSKTKFPRDVKFLFL